VIAEQLIRSGRAFLQGVSSPAVLLEMISDSDDDKTKNFWQHVVIVEVDPNNKRTAVQPVQSWGSWHTPEGKKKPDFVPDERIARAPVFLPSGGNPLHAQGFYGFPIYPVWEKHWTAFAEHPKGVRSFLAPRLEKTADVDLSEEMLEQICRQVHEVAKAHESDGKVLAVMILAIASEGSTFYLSPAPCADGQIALSQLIPNHAICADAKVMLERIWEAKAKEGEEKGRLEQGVCAFTGKRGPVISGDNKSWPWFTTTWQAPFPEIFGDTDHVYRLAFSLEAYKHLTVGATLFGKLTKQLDYNLNKQLFAPVDSAGGRENAMRGQVKSTVFGSAIVTPLLDSVNLGEDDKQAFAYGLQTKIEHRGRRRGASLLLSNLLGYDEDLPPELLNDQFRLTSIYFSGDPTRADIHLQAVIEDVVPSVLVKINTLLEETSDWAQGFYTDRQAWLHQRMKSLPFLLVSAYGPSSLWMYLSDVLHTQALPWEPFVRGVAHRCDELSHNLTDHSLGLRNEAVLYATFRHFFDLYHRAFGLERRAMRPWQELVKNISSTSVHEMTFQDVEEVGFAAGYLVRQFSRQYFRAANEKDYLQHRVMTFGSDLTPDVIYRRALGKLPEYAMRVNAHLSEDFRQRLGVWLSAYPSMKSDVKKHSDEFMAAFWAGYMLGRVE
jgi:hypothetical protein